MYLHRQHHGFTLIELAVIITIIVVLIAILLPGIEKHRTQDSVIRNAQQVRYIHQGLLSHSYQRATKRFPFHQRKPAFGKELRRTLLWGNHVAGDIMISPFDHGDDGSFSYNTSSDADIWWRTDDPTHVVIGDRMTVHDHSSSGYAWGYNDNHVAIKTAPDIRLAGSDFQSPDIDH